jgi:hypothetical protein
MPNLFAIIIFNHGSLGDSLSALKAGRAAHFYYYIPASALAAAQDVCPNPCEDK